jgi:hypothetical protein
MDVSLGHEQTLENRKRPASLLHRQAPCTTIDLHADVELGNDERPFILTAR